MAIVSRFKDGTERAGAFLRNPTNEKIVHLYQTKVSKVTYWEGHGFCVSVIGDGPVWGCRSGGFSGNIVDENGKIVATVPPPPPPEPRYEPGHREAEPMPGTADAPVHFCENAPTITTLTPTFVLPRTPQGNKLHVFVQTVGWMDVCEAQDLPMTTRVVKVPAGMLEPGRSYDLLVSASGALGSSLITLCRFRVAEKDKLSGGEDEVTFTPAQGRLAQ
ncbi:MAG TPA: hypothetical protein VK157_06760 [Phycisphaerales bacterium]|nr:hypothetical protein [Phycisphaerales bacterium]